jgi:AcrR family transcriptional regulator
MATVPGVGRMRILQAARSLFLERGYADVSMQQIADAASVTKATLYHHFRDKVDLYVSVVIWEHEQIGHLVNELIAGAVSLEEELERIAIAFLTSSEADFGRIARDLNQHVAPERLREIHAMMHDASVVSPEAVIRGCFARAIERGEIIPIDPDIPFALFFSMIHGLKQFSEMPDAAGRIGEREAALVPKILLQGIAASSTLQAADFPRYDPLLGLDTVLPFGARHDTPTPRR